MKPTKTLAWIGCRLALAVMLAQIPRAAETPAGSYVTHGTGTIAGFVSSVKTGNMLQGAIVQIPALDRQLITDNSGRFTASGLPLGPLDIVVSYTGLKEERRTVVV